MKNILFLASLILSTSAIVHAQLPIYSLQAKGSSTLNRSESIVMSNQNPPDRFVVRAVPVKVLLAYVFDVRGDLIAELPSSLGTMSLDIDAKMLNKLDEFRHLTGAQFLQEAFAEHFGLKTHIKTKEEKGCELLKLPGKSHF